jgi:hypothetical protein
MLNTAGVTLRLIILRRGMDRERFTQLNEWVSGYGADRCWIGYAPRLRRRVRRCVSVDQR